MDIMPKELKGKNTFVYAKELIEFGCFFMMVKQYTSAIDIFHKAIACNILDAVAWRNCSVATKEAGWDTELVDQYEKMADNLEKHTSGDHVHINWDADAIPEPVKKAITEFFGGVQL